ncbi:MAG: carbamoyltransferase HypF [Methylovulum sp.]|uniref:carbamoyltransferase HypF n=1 Tax=Methylovulum sp. TaxID=1916980 RepID=UPI00262439EB|nr:carbamoyltransferase HypF [Methylovulum sp.]MDD2722413.1 carbamoyltransferase HypF [Methylovulum sp.]MDD5125608.1 carbamoyltransferase HypF [Methylovulum sp.]
MSEILAIHIVITGRVQGVGFRPFVSRFAHELGLAGWVRNCSGQVEIHAEGSGDALTAFKLALIDHAPPLAQPECPLIFPVEPCGYPGFTIEPSEDGDHTDAHIPPDYFVCNDCLAEMQNPAERRHRYPFINCTQCGPRYTLIDRLPYDRPNTAMVDFTLCPECQSEYSNPLDRRYHAQPLACPRCGPSLSFRRSSYPDLCGDEVALAACLAALHEGLIVAVKGVGGYHLLCDAAQADSVRRLRERKHRPNKPLAVLVPWRGKDGLELADQLAELEEPEKHGLCSPLRPIVLVKKRANTLLTESVAPDLNEIGLMLPYSPLHHLLADGFGKPLVATSANLSGEPVLTDGGEVETRLSQVADAYLHHNRPIRRPADDSVYRLVAGKSRPIRLGRGLAPMERKLPFWLEQPVLAVGADLKNTVALGFRDRVVVSPHIGDLGSLRSSQVFEQVVADLQRLYGVSPQAIVCDAHPGYHSSRWAKQQGLPVIPVFHHHAHASALVGEHGLAGQMLVFTWDGTGYGEDGGVWGGEALLGEPGHWRRVGALRPFYLPGGDKASREPWRCALSVCWEQGIDWPDCGQDASLLRQVWERRINCPATSSAGRLFDAAAALIGVVQHSTYEGHAAMRLEAIGSPSSESIALPLAQNSAGVFVSDWGALLPFLLDTKLSPAERSSVFHASLAAAITDQAKAIGGQHGITRVGLSGGVFQNRLLTEQALSALEQAGFEVFLHEAVPSGDGGISLGQVIEAGSQ